MKPSPESSRVDRKRRIIIGWGGTGLLTLIAGYLGWRTAQSKPAPLPKQQQPRLVNSNGEPLPPPEPITEPPATTPIREGFAEHLGSEFEVDVDGLPRPCKLVQVTEGRRLHGKGVTYTAFSILFESHAAYKFEGRIYTLRHEALGRMELFLSQVGPSDKHSYLEAVFSERI